MILVLDNYDSFVHNLARYLRRCGQETVVVRSDQIDVAGCRGLKPDAIVISPGPKRPSEAGCCIEVIRQLGPRIPTLGICLGHQAIGEAFGGNIIKVPPVHGMETEIHCQADGLFQRCHQPMTVGRYHSLAIERDSLPSELTITATTHDGVIMAIRHETHPIHGWQFHPESVLTPDGNTMIENFVAITRSDQASP